MFMFQILFQMASLTWGFGEILQVLTINFPFLGTASRPDVLHGSAKQDRWVAYEVRDWRWRSCFNWRPQAQAGTQNGDKTKEKVKQSVIQVFQFSSLQSSFVIAIVFSTSNVIITYKSTVISCHNLKMSFYFVPIIVKMFELKNLSYQHQNEPLVGVKSCKWDFSQYTTGPELCKQTMIKA